MAIVELDTVMLRKKIAEAELMKVSLSSILKMCPLCLLGVGTYVQHQRSYINVVY